MHRKLDYQGTIDLFDELVSKHKQLATFVINDTEDISSKVKEGTKVPALILIDYDEDIAEKSDNGQSVKDILIGVVKNHSTKSRNVSSVQTIQNDCRELCLDVYSYLRKLKRENQIPGLQLGLSEGSPLKFKAGSFFGWGFVLTIKTPENLSYKSENWN